MTVKGFIIGRYLETAREKLDEETFKSLEKDLGVDYRTLKHAYFANYPVELQMAVEEKVSRLVWNESYLQAAPRIGRMNFDSFRESAVGRTTLALLGQNPRRVVQATVKLVSKVLNGVEIIIEDRGENQMSIRLSNSPHLPEAWQATLEAAVEHAGGTPSTRIIRHGKNDNEFVVTWA